ncbi:GNAT family N-acetyltransferase [Kribbella albertanoniae]|uniref:GNAT family N-acetyltransferase n=1 Tax=Kribbella albertanoniae TaxID=1266829 RepID=A0A4R4PMR8_9ACTN|nr:GNAT family N-acetyltransferase [Kribbella albertanoniae]TDC23358.1 GNAT family N-acetyltransferase [Kribbella albertanoniae]
MSIRNTVETDLDTIRTLIEQQQTVNTVTLDRYNDYLETGHYRHDWTWVVEENGVIQALAIWWGGSDDAYPYSIDGLYYAGDGDPVPTWTELIKHGMASRPADAEPPEYHFFLDGDWESDAAVVAALEPRVKAGAAAGWTAITDRLRYEWLAEYGLPPRSTRLHFEPADDDAFVDMFMRVSAGSLDAATARDVARLGAEAAAREEVALYQTMLVGDRRWWRFGYDAEGKLIGFAIPSKNNGGPVVGYLGVLPEHRGHGYIDDLLAEITHLLAETGAEQIRADTDFGNVPMAKAFERGGYRNFAVRRVLSFPEA